MTIYEHNQQLNSVRRSCSAQRDHTEQTLRKRIKRIRNNDNRRRLNNIADGILIAGAGIGVYMGLYGLAAFLQWCSTGTWI